jgi:hypothetical protein
VLLDQPQQRQIFSLHQSHFHTLAHDLIKQLVEELRMHLAWRWFTGGWQLRGGECRQGEPHSTGAASGSGTGSSHGATVSCGPGAAAAENCCIDPTFTEDEEGESAIWLKVGGDADLLVALIGGVLKTNFAGLGESFNEKPRGECPAEF